MTKYLYRELYKMKFIVPSPLLISRRTKLKLNLKFKLCSFVEKRTEKEKYSEDKNFEL